MAETDLRVELVGGILVGTLVPPGGASSFTLGLLSRLDDLCARAERDDGVRAVVVTGTGPTFSVGTDLDQIATGLSDFVQFRSYLHAFKATTTRLEALPVPTVAAVNGLTRAGGLELVLACDFAVIARDARIGDGHSAQYAIPAGGSTQRLPRRVGVARAKDLIWSGRFLTAQESVEWGLCHRAVPAEELMGAAESLLAPFVDKPRACIAETKSLIARSATTTLEDGTELEVQAFLHYVQNEPFVREAFADFLAERRRGPRPATAPAGGAPSPGSAGPAPRVTGRARTGPAPAGS